MKYFKFIITPVIILMIGLTISCERDDICPESTSTTPKLNIAFFDDDNTENKKNVSNLVVAGLDNEILDGFSFVNIANVELPLKTDEDSSQYTFIEGSTINDNGTPNDEDDDFIDGNYDTIIINYTRELVFVSRACGYKTIYKNVTIDIVDDGNNWILSQQSANDNQPIEDEATTHFNLFH